MKNIKNLNPGKVKKIGLMKSLGQTLFGKPKKMTKTDRMIASMDNLDFWLNQSMKDKK